MLFNFDNHNVRPAQFGFSENGTEAILAAQPHPEMIEDLGRVGASQVGLHFQVEETRGVRYE